MCRRLGWIEEWAGAPDLVDVVDAEGGMLEQVGGLLVDLERIVIIQEVEIEQGCHTTSGSTNGYGGWAGVVVSNSNGVLSFAELFTYGP